MTNYKSANQRFGMWDKGCGTGADRLGGSPFSIFIFLISFFLMGCDMGEIPVPPHEPGEVLTEQVMMGADYRYSSFFDLETGVKVGEYIKTTWDIGIAQTEGGQRIRLNASKLMAAAITDATSLADITDADAADWKVDAPSGNLDATAVGQWQDGRVRVIDLGYSITGIPLGMMKIRAEEGTDGVYVHFSALASTDSTTIVVPDDATLNMVCISLAEDGSIVPIEPPKDTWHLHFTQYTHVFVDGGEVIPYLVTGVLTNPTLVEALRIDTVPFDSIDLAMAEALSYSPDVNMIGYDWKEYSFDTGSYTIYTEQCYLLRFVDGSFYKLRFLDFYTPTGEKGAPLFEYQRL